jgi:hypothetical protein
VRSFAGTSRALQYRASMSAAAGPRTAAALRCTTRTRAVSPRRIPSGTFSARPTACPMSWRHSARCLATGWQSSCRNARKRPLRMSPSIRWARWQSRCRIAWLPDALEYRLGDSGAHLAIVDADDAAGLLALRASNCRSCGTCSAFGGAAGKGVRRGRKCSSMPRHATRRRHRRRRPGDDPLHQRHHRQAEGALMAHRTLLGKLSGYVCSHDFFPQPRDLFWSPADWAWTAVSGRCCLPTWHFGMPLLAYKGRFDAGRAFALIEKYGIRNCFLPLTTLSRMMAAAPEPRAIYDLDLRTLDKRLATGWCRRCCSGPGRNSASRSMRCSGRSR